MNFITKEQVSKSSSGTTISGVALITNFSIAKTKNGSDYTRGRMKTPDGAIDFKIWSGETHDKLHRNPNDYTGKVVQLLGKVNEWQGSRSIDIDSITPMTEEIDQSVFHATNYNIDELEKEFYTTVKSKVTPETLAVFKAIYESVRLDFRNEYAASSIHDAVRGGLLAHTTKMLRLLNLVVDTYGNIHDNLDHDLLFMGLALHDVGKIYEYKLGVRTEMAFATHNLLGARLLFQFEDAIVKAKGMDFHLRLLAILQQHHGEFGEPCQTVESYLIHLVDMFESRLTMFNEQLPFEGELRVEFGKYRLV